MFGVRLFDGCGCVELCELGSRPVKNPTILWVWAFLAYMATEKFGVVGDGVSDAANRWGVLVF